MLRGHPATLLLVAALALVLSACSDDLPTTPTQPPRASPDEFAGELPLRLPVGGIAAPVPSDVRTQVPPASARSGPSRVADPIDLTADLPPSAIMNARTEAGFRPGFAFSYGTHDYVGNMGRVETTATASHEDKFLGSQMAPAQQFYPFIVDFGRVKNIWVWAKIFTDHTCGVTVRGSSVHSAWWEFFQGTGASDWGQSTVFTQSSGASQPACTRGTGGYGATEVEPGGLICSYWITYDIDTGAIINADFLGCVHSDDPKI